MLTIATSERERCRGCCLLTNHDSDDHQRAAAASDARASGCDGGNGEWTRVASARRAPSTYLRARVASPRLASPRIASRRVVCVEKVLKLESAIQKSTSRESLELARARVI